MADTTLKFEKILHGARGTSSEGTLNFNESGMTWKRSSGTSTVAIKKADISEVRWTLAPAGGLLRVRQHDKVTAIFHGFSKSDEGRIEEYAATHWGIKLISQAMGVAGHNWGNLSVHGSSLAFETIDGKHMFELPLTEIGEIQGTKEDAILEFHVDDATISTREDALCSVTFVIPDENDHFPADAEEGKTAADVFKAAIFGKTDTLAGDGDDAITTLPNVQSLYPRGRYDLSLYPGFMDMDGQTHQFKIRYTNLDRLYTLPRPAPAGNLVIIHMENAIRRGQTYYEWIACNFDTNAYVDNLELNASEEFIAKKNADNRANMQRSMTGATDQVFTRLLRGLSGAKVTKHGTFRAADGVSCFLACSYKNDAGTLYPLERSFLYTFKPELIPYDHIDSIEFERQQSGLHAASLRTFDLAVTIRPDAATRTKAFLFRSIQKQEWEPLLNFLEEKGVRIANLDQARQGPGLAGNPLPLAVVGVEEEDEEDDDDFGGAGVPGEEDSDFDDSAGSSGSDEDNESDAELIPEEGISVEAVGGKARRRSSGGGAAASPAASEGEAEANDVEEEPEAAPKKRKKATKDKPVKDKPAKEGKDGKPVKKKAKKDPNAPKRGMSAYMHFSNDKRAEVKASNPGLSFADIAKKMGETWKAITDAEKARYEELAAKDKKRYEREMAEYKAKGGGAGAADDG